MREVSSSVEDLVSQLVPAYRHLTRASFDFYHALGKSVLLLSKDYGSYAVELLAVELKRNGVDIGRSSLYASTKYVTNLTPAQKAFVLNAGFSVRMLNRICQDNVSPELRQVLLDTHKHTRLTFKQVCSLIDRAAANPGVGPVVPMDAHPELEEEKAMEQIVSSVERLLVIRSKPHTGRHILLKTIFNQISERVLKNA